MKYTISIIAYNNLALTKRCVESVLLHAGSGEFGKTDQPPTEGTIELILTDNGSMDGTDRYFYDLAKSRYNILHRYNEKNEGFIAPNREALNAARGELFVLLNNDMTVVPGWLETLAAPFATNHKAALSGPEGNCCHVLPNFHGTQGPFEYLEGSCLMGRTEILKSHGLFPQELSGCYGEDSALSLRMREAGYSLHRVKLYLPHVRGATSAMVPQARKWQEDNHAYLRRRFAHYLKVRYFEFPIIVRRTDAWGDVLLTTPIIRAIKKCRPLSPIWVETNCTDIFRDNPYVSKCAQHVPRPPSAMFIDLNMSYENKTETHIVDAYTAAATSVLVGDFRVEERSLDIYLRPQEIPTIGYSPGGKFAAVHAGPVSWGSKEWGAEKFNVVTKELMARGWTVILVGNVKTAPIACTVDMRGRTTVHQMAAIIGAANLFLGLDSLPFHVAQAMGTPAVGIFGITDSKYIESAPSHSVNADHPSHGLRHRTLNARVVDDGGAAIRSISSDHVLLALSVAIIK